MSFLLSQFFHKLCPLNICGRNPQVRGHFLLDRLGVQYGIRLLLKSWLVYWQELYCDRLKRGCKEKKHGPPHTMDLVPGPRGQVGVRVAHSDGLYRPSSLKSTSMEPNKSFSIGGCTLRKNEHLRPAERRSDSGENSLKSCVSTLVAATIHEYCVTHGLDGRHAGCLAVLNPGNRRTSANGYYEDI